MTNVLSILAVALTMHSAIAEELPRPASRIEIVIKSAAADDAQAWRTLIENRRPAWEAETSSLAKTFGTATPPPAIRIVIDHGNGEDAFTIDARTIAFNTARLQSEYGDATKPENAARIDRFFRHEYTHLLQKAWLAGGPYVTDTPMREALLGIWTEGLGNHYSLSERWLTADGAPTELAQKALAELTPQLVARLAALPCADRTQSAELQHGLSMGRFDQKWGALPVALWLAADAKRSPYALNQFALLGPEGVWNFIADHVSPELGAVLEEARDHTGRCADPAWKRVTHDRSRSLTHDTNLTLLGARTPVRLRFYSNPVRTESSTGVIGFEFAVARFEAMPAFHFDDFEGPNPPSYDRKLLEAAVIRDGKVVDSFRVSPSGFLTVDGGFAFEVSAVFDEPNTVAKKILRALTAGADALRITVTDTQDARVQLAFDIPMAGRRDDFQWLLADLK